LKYYESFLESFPTIHHLASATDEKIFKTWEGLGYYSRCRNLIDTARYISLEKEGKFPGDYESILALRGVGPYTAAAISSFAFGLPHAVVDGNVSRVLSRVFGIAEPVNSTRGKKIFGSLATGLLDKKNPAGYNQAIMDFGATVCKPASPICGNCIYNDHCIAYRENAVDKFPSKTKPEKAKTRWFNYFILRYQGQVAVRKRTGKDIWQNLYELPLIETPSKPDSRSLLVEMKMRKWTEGVVKGPQVSKEYKQQLTHQIIFGRFLDFHLHKKPVQADWSWLDMGQMKKLAFPKLIREYLFTPAEQ
jgi:A/G-specific adenine glycosylase